MRSTTQPYASRLLRPVAFAAKLCSSPGLASCGIARKAARYSQSLMALLNCMHNRSSSHLSIAPRDANTQPHQITGAPPATKSVAHAIHYLPPPTYHRCLHAPLCRCCTPRASLACCSTRHLSRQPFLSSSSMRFLPKQQAPLPSLCCATQTAQQPYQKNHHLHHLHCPDPTPAAAT